MAFVKVCGVTTAQDARACADLGVDAIGVNFVASSLRRVDEPTARAIVQAVGARVLVVGVVADLDVATMRALRQRTGVGCLQLHGSEPPSDLEALLPHAYKAVRIASEADVLEAEGVPGEYIMVDAKVEGSLGGTGSAFDWRLVTGLAARRKLVLAGGLTPANVTAAIERVHPWCVDVASGVEHAAGVKNLDQVRAFVQAAHAGVG